MAKIDVIMPQMGESIAEGTLSRWIKKVGDAVKRDEPIFEISTDKVDAEIPAPAAGTLAEILVQEGQTVAVQTVVAKIETDASVGGGSPPPRACARAGSAAPALGAPTRGGPLRASTPAPAASRSSSRASPRARPARRRRREMAGVESAEERLRRQVHAAGAPDRGRAQPRYQRDPGQRARRPGDEERRARVSGARRRGPRRGPAGRRLPAAPAHGPQRPRPTPVPGWTRGRETPSSRGRGSASSRPSTWSCPDGCRPTSTPSSRSTTPAWRSSAPGRRRNTPIAA